jgi:hypothetical protein
MATRKTTAEQYEEAQRAEWSKYTAVVAIDYYGVRAFNVGDPVPASVVDGDGAWVDQSWVSRKADAYAGSQTVPPPEPPTIDPTTAAAPPAATPITVTEG